jgi:hypothetical protein
MSHEDRLPVAVFEPRDVEALAGAYRAVLDEVSEGGALSDLWMSSLPARDIRRIAAREVIEAAASGARDRTELIRRSLQRIATFGGRSPS